MTKSKPTEAELRALRQDAVAAIVRAAKGFPRSELAALVAALALELAGITAPRFTINQH
jgi:hypothetical protein